MSSTFSSDGAISQLSEVESNLIRVQSDSSFPSEFDITSQQPGVPHHHASHSAAGANGASGSSGHHQHRRRHRNRKQRRFSADSNSTQQLPPSGAPESQRGSSRGHRHRTKTAGPG